MLLALAVSLTAAMTCGPVAGGAKLWADPRTNYVMVGEMHGTTETPALFGDLACAAHVSRRPVVIALEVPESQQDTIDRFIASDSDDEAAKSFLRSPIWNAPIKDGRSSQAYFDLCERLRILKRAGRIADVIAIQPVYGNELDKSESDYNAAMARRIRAAGARHPKAIVLVLVGSFHAGKGAVTFGSETIVPAAADLPPAETISLKVAVDGEAWNCDDSDPPVCGPHKRDGPKPQRRAVTLGPKDLPRFDGVIDLGVPATASPPVAP